MKRKKSGKKSAAKPDEELAALRRRVAELEAADAERRRAEEKLRDSEERFRVALKGSKITVFQQDRDLRYTWVHNPNPGLAVEDVVGNTDADLVPAEDATVLTGIKRRVLEKGVGENAEIRFSVGGEPFYYDITLEPLRGRSGDVVTTVRPRVCRD